MVGQTNDVWSIKRSLNNIEHDNKKRENFYYKKVRFMKVLFLLLVY